MTERPAVRAIAHTAAFKAIWALVRPFWLSPKKLLHGGLLIALLLLALVSTYVAVALTHWQGAFADMMVHYDHARIVPVFLVLGGILVLEIVSVTATNFVTAALSIRWRSWLTTRFLRGWLSGKSFFWIEQGRLVDNPDQRITEDIDQFVTTTLSLVLGLFGTVVSLISFSTMIWTKSGSVDFKAWGLSIHIPGFMLWIAIGYALLTTAIVQFAGRRLVTLNFQKQQAEANFRFMMAGVREHAEQIALLEGGATEVGRMQQGFEGVRRNFWRIAFFNLHFTPVNAGIVFISAFFPMIALMPRYFSHSVSYGDITQMAAAFGRVSIGLQWFVVNYVTVQQYRVVVARLRGLDIAVKSPLVTPGPRYVHSISSQIEVRLLELSTPEGRALLAGVNFCVRPGERWLIRGASGVGKSTLLRALAGIWRFGSGEIAVPERAKLLFLPQKNYLPPGSLRQALCYPGEVDAFDDAMCRRALADCQLGDYQESLDLDAPWGHRMSPGEQQRLGFARALLQQPDYLLLDESTSALDEENERRLYELITERFPQIAIVSISHHRSVEAFHTHLLDIDQGQAYPIARTCAA
jgi:vitamin B12/bleomycin/antimicrobial peptide transport system ATP-binding/permease protein